MRQATPIPALFTNAKPDHLDRSFRCINTSNYQLVRTRGQKYKKETYGHSGARIIILRGYENMLQGEIDSHHENFPYSFGTTRARESRTRALYVPRPRALSLNRRPRRGRGVTFKAPLKPVARVIFTDIYIALRRSSV